MALRRWVLLAVTALILLGVGPRGVRGPGGSSTSTRPTSDQTRRRRWLGRRGREVRNLPRPLTRFLLASSMALVAWLPGSVSAQETTPLGPTTNVPKVEDFGPVGPQAPQPGASQ